MKLIHRCPADLLCDTFQSLSIFLIKVFTKSVNGGFYCISKLYIHVSVNFSQQLLEERKKLLDNKRTEIQAQDREIKRLSNEQKRLEKERQEHELKLLENGHQLTAAQKGLHYAESTVHFLAHTHTHTFTLKSRRLYSTKTFLVP